MNTLIRMANAAPVFVIALSLVTITATTNDVIFSFEEEEGEYADTDLETDSAGNIYGTIVLGGEFGGGTVFQLRPTPNGWEHTVLYSFTGGADGGEPHKGVTIRSTRQLVRHQTIIHALRMLFIRSRARKMVVFPTTAWWSIDSETSTARLCTAARTTTVASTSSRVEAAATSEIRSVLVESCKNIGL